MKLAIKCRKCGAGRSYTAEQVIAALKRSETGDGNAGVNELGQRVRGKCKACGYPGWVVEVVRPAVGAGGLPLATQPDTV